MQTEPQSTIAHGASLPIDVRAALDRIVVDNCTFDGGIRAHVIGQEHLRDELQRYVWIEEDPSCLIALDAEPNLLHEGLTQFMPVQVITLTVGSLAQPLRRMRRSPALHARDLPATTWRSLGYNRVCSYGFQGIGSLAWAIGQRLCWRVGRPDLADRCRIGMLRTLLTSRVATPVATARVRTYRRMKL